MCNPAQKASEETLRQIYSVLDRGNSFRVEAGAGAGKTYSLIKALQYLIKRNSQELQKNSQNIACITYTNVATDEIRNRIDNNPTVYVDTIHGFCWSILKRLQSQLREQIKTIGDSKLNEKIEEAGGWDNQIVVYDLGYRNATKREISIHHDNVIKIFTNLLSKEKFRKILKSQYPIIFIDEYQDTDLDLGNAIIEHLVDTSSNIQVGLFGDNWQRIYDKGIGEITSEEVVIINKNANFRSEKKIVEFLNRMRTDLPQEVKDRNSNGDIKIFHTNSWSGTRRDGGHWKGDLPEEEVSFYFKIVYDRLREDGWDFSCEKTKILMLTNSALAREQGYEGISKVFRFNDDYLKMQDKYIDFFVNILEPVLNHFCNSKYGEMFKALGVRTPRLENHNEKRIWNKSLSRLIDLRNKGTIGEVIECLQETKKPRLSARIEDSEEKYSKFKVNEHLEDERDVKFVSKITNLKALKYTEIIELAKYIYDKTPFSTNHGVKGAEFDNVFVVCGRGWNHYNWNDFLSWSNDGIPNNKKKAFDRNRNLFYVSCSRPKQRLAVLFTQELSNSAISTLNRWFLPENISDLCQG